MQSNTKTFSELLDTKQSLTLEMIIETIDHNGYPDFDVYFNRKKIDLHKNKIHVIKKDIDLFEPLLIEVNLKNKKYSSIRETAVIIKEIKVEEINVIPYLNHLIKYVNDHDVEDTTHYIGYNGSWSLNIDKPFFQWYHEKNGQGMLIKDIS